MSLTVVMTTLASEAAAQNLARCLVDERFAACAQIVACESHYVFEGEQHADREWRVELKTTEAARDALMQRVAVLHPYDVPEVIALPIMAASTDYAAWVCNNVGPTGE
ncbi:MAG: divalent-cation tolerance protein CutA [Pseudomonadota bacterium]